MVGQADNSDKNESRKIAIALIVLALAVLVAGVLLWPSIAELAAVHLSPGLGIKDSAIIAFVVTIVIMVVFAIASGDGLLGEIQFILGGFFLFFLIVWTLIAWVF